ncbi:MAG: hypothetical protein AAGK04_03540 [Planctomycetota bacterium]
MAKKKKKAAATRGRKKTSTRGARGGGLHSVSTEVLAAELRRRERDLRSLERRRAKLIEQLDEVEREIAQFGGMLGGASGARRRPRNKQSLEDSLYDVLKGQTMSVSELSDAVRAAGYMTTSKTFNTIVNQTLIKSKRFKKISHGRYTTTG